MADPVLPPPTPAVISRAEAKALGLKRYFSGKPCPLGHVAERSVVNFTCVSCQTIKGKLRHHANADKANARRRAHYEANRKKHNLSSRDWVRSNPEKAAEIKRRWRDENLEKVRTSNRQWSKNNPGKMRSNSAKRRAKIASAEGSYTAADVQRIHNAQNGECKYCGVKVGTNYHVDHIEPLARGGSNWPSNLQVLCPSCNTRKGAMSAREYEWIIGYPF